METLELLVESFEQIALDNNMLLSNKHLKEMLERRLGREVAVKEFKKIRKYNSVITCNIPNKEDVKINHREGFKSARLLVEWCDGSKVIFRSNLDKSEFVIKNNPNKLNLSKLHDLLGDKREMFDTKIKRIKKYLEDKHDINEII